MRTYTAKEVERIMVAFAIASKNTQAKDVRNTAKDFMTAWNVINPAQEAELTLPDFMRVEVRY